MTGQRASVGSVDVPTGHFIGGEWRPGSGETMSVLSPIDQQELTQVAAGGPDEVAAAVRAARAAFPAWAELEPIARGQVLDAFAQRIRERKQELSTVETLDNGSLLIANQKRIVDRAAHNLEFFSRRALELSSDVIEGSVVDNHVRHEPAGVAALITPWNAPLMLSTWKLGPALAAGNTVVLKPPEWAPLSCALLAEIAAEVGIPRGVFNLVHGEGARAGQALVGHPDVDRISFTGSVETGRRVGAAAAANVTPASLELGGKSAFVVFEDADLEQAAKTVAAQFNNAGQVCLAGTRILVHASIARDFQARVLEACKPFQVGDPRERGVRVGPLIHPRQLERVSGLVARALDAGAHPLLGGSESELGGLYYQPTILANVKQDDEIVQQEVFGPVLTWQTFEHEDEACELANGTTYGLAAVLYSGERARAERVASRLVAGTVWVNCFFVRDLEAPFGGARQSGVGREGGLHSFDFFCDIKNVAIKHDSFTGEAEAADG